MYVYVYIALLYLREPQDVLTMVGTQINNHHHNSLTSTKKTSVLKNISINDNVARHFTQNIVSTRNPMHSLSIVI